MRRTQAEAAQTRQELLDAALNVFSASGCAAARLEAIAAQVNLQHTLELLAAAARFRQITALRL